MRKQQFGTSMFSQDYIMRQIQQLTQVLNTILIQVLRIKKEGHEAETIAFTNEMLEEQLGFDLSNLSEILKEQGVPHLKRETGFSNDHLNILADILYELGESTFENEKQHNQSLSLLSQSLLLFEFIEQDERIYSIDRNLKITQIKDILN